MLFTLPLLALAALTTAIPQTGSTSLSTTVLTQTATSVSTTTIHSTSTSATTTSPPSATETCLAACSKTDICCQAACVNVPCPSPAQVNATTECASLCPQGNGTAPDTASYASCQQNCISSLFYSSSSITGAEASTGAASASASTTGSEGGSATSTATATGSSSASGSAASASKSGGAESLKIGQAAGGILGLMLVGLAL